MQKLVISNTSYEYLLMGFKEWLGVLGYSAGTVTSVPRIVREFLHFLQSQPIKGINELRQLHIRNYYSYVSQRANIRRGGGLSNNYLNKHLQAIEKFLEYLRHRGMEQVPALGIRQEKLYRKEITPLSVEEIKQLFAVTDRECENEIEEAISARDKVMLVVYYSCGLRRNEGVNLDLSDINLDTRIVHVRKGKNYKERFVPLNKTNARYIQQYIFDYRPLLVKKKTEGALFISRTGEAMSAGALYSRFKLLQQMTDDVSLQQKPIGLHALRHSIATHLLEAGMQMEMLSRFLGHSSLESTQIYTHIVEKESGVLL